MKKLLFIALFVSTLTYAQNSTPELEINGNQVKATYYYEWLSYDQMGNLLSVAEYQNGAKTGKWTVYSNAIPVKEIDYLSNQIISITETTSTALASKN